MNFGFYNFWIILVWTWPEINQLNWTSDFQSEHKFKSTTWYGFFEKFLVPDIEANIHLNQPVTQIDYSGNQVMVITEDGTEYQGDKVLVTVPVKILQNRCDSLPRYVCQLTAALLTHSLLRWC